MNKRLSFQNQLTVCRRFKAPLLQITPSIWPLLLPPFSFFLKIFQKSLNPPPPSPKKKIIIIIIIVISGGSHYADVIFVKVF